MSEDLNKLREPYIVARVNWQEDNGDDHQRAVTLGDDLAVTSHHYVKALERRLQAAEERAEKAEAALRIISDGTVSSAPEGHYLAHRAAVKAARAALKTGA